MLRVLLGYVNGEEIQLMREVTHYSVEKLITVIDRLESMGIDVELRFVTKD